MKLRSSPWGALPLLLVAALARPAADTAWLPTLSRTTGTFWGKAVSSRGAETMLLRRSGGVWTLVHLHGSSRS